MPTALIAGGGIAGVAAALGFVRAGWSATVFEQAAALGEVGAGLQLSPNACKVLGRLGVLPDIRARANAPEAAEMRDGVTGELIYRAALAADAEARWGAPYLHILRADLLDVLAGAASKAGVGLELGKTAVGAVSRTDSAALHLREGTAREGDVVVGADGIRSALRTVMGPAEEPRFTGQVAWRGLVPAGALPREAVGPTVTVWVGAGRHVVTYPVRGGRLVNFVAVLERAEWAEEGWSAPGDPGELRAAFADWAAPVTAVLEAVGDCFLWGLFDRPEQVRWTRERIALIGDAAHPMLPFLAQGAAMALEDGAALVRRVAGANTGIPAALAAYEEERWPRIARVLQRSRANGRLFHQPAGVVRSIVHGFMGAFTRSTPQLAVSQLDWLYGHDATVAP
jgi:salicylate hydroxylase